MPDNKARKYTLSELIEQYIRLHLSKFPCRLKDQTSHLNWWRENYGHKPLIEISPSLLAEAKEILLNGITSRKTNSTNSTVNRYFSSLGRAFTLAFQEWQWINENPFRRVSKLKENGGRNRFLSREELYRFSIAAKKVRTPIFTVWSSSPPRWDCVSEKSPAFAGSISTSITGLRLSK